MLHLLGEVLIGVVAVVAVALCVSAWRLSQGPVDVTWLIRREHRLLDGREAQIGVGHAQIGWDGFRAIGQPLELSVQDLDLRRPDGHVAVRQARIGLSVTNLLVGRLVVRQAIVDGVEGELNLASLGAGSPGGGKPAGAPAWLRRLDRVALTQARLTLHGGLPGADVVLSDVAADGRRAADDGFSGQLSLAVTAGGARAAVKLHAAMPAAGGAALDVATGDIVPAALAMLSPGTIGLRALDLPVRLDGHVVLDSGLALVSGRLGLNAGAGMVRAEQGGVAVASASASLTASPGHLQLDDVHVALARPDGLELTDAPAPVITGHAAATREAGRVRAAFTVDIKAAEFADLPVYFPEGTGGGARDWLVQNVPAGHAHDAHVSGTLEGPADLSDVEITALSGGVQADDVTLYWLRPIPPLQHAQARVTIEGPDSLRAVMTAGGQNNLVLKPGSSIRVTGLSARHQFGDIDVGLSGALPDAIGLLNHPRLRLLARGGLDVEGASGAVVAEMKMHVPLEDQVTMDQITVGANAALTDVHLGRIAGGRDLDHGDLHLAITNDGLTAGGTGDIATIPADLTLAMDFRPGPPDQVLQHVTAKGRAGAAQLTTAGAPAMVTHLLASGAAGLDVDYAGRRDGGATIQVGADLQGASVKTPLGWEKPAGQAAGFGGQVQLDHGHVVGVDRLHAEGPGLVIASRAQFAGGRETLVLDRLEVGRTRAAGSVVFPADAKAPLRVDLHGSMLDLSPQLDQPEPAAPPVAHTGPPPEADETPGQPWGVKLAFDGVQLARGKILAPLRAEAASDGLHLSRVEMHAGTRGEIVASIEPRTGGRTVAVSAEDAGLALRAFDLADNFDGGRLSVNAFYNDTRRGSPLSGTASMDNFNLRNAPAVGRLLQAMTVYGLTDVARGPGLHFSRMVLPFVWQNHVLTLNNARAFSPSLGITARGDLDLWHRIANVGGTVVPAYFFNQLLGDLPLVGKLFSPEKGGGVFAARYSLRGSLDNPKIGLNPLSALTPGFLREGFGLFKAPVIAARAQGEK